MNNRKLNILLMFTILTICSSETFKDIEDSTFYPKMKFLALGDSYTIGEGVDEDGRWPVQLVKQLSKEGYYFTKPDIIATTGWTTTELKAAIHQKRPSHNYDLVSLLIGVNNQYRGQDQNIYRKEFRELLEMAISFASDVPSKVFVVSIPDYGVTPFAEGKNRDKISKEIDDYNAINKLTAEELGVSYIDITPQSRDAAHDITLLAADHLHPSARMYNGWVNTMVPSVIQLLENNK